jgi:aspartate aminotransferase
MTIPLSQRVGRIDLAPNVIATKRAGELRAQGHDIIILTSGEPDFDTPDFIKRAAAVAAERGDTKYTLTNGTLELRQAVADKFRRENGIEYSLHEIIIANGAKHVIANAFAATLDAGAEVIVPAPYWPSFPDIVKINDGRVVAITGGENVQFKLTAEALADAITPRTRWLVLNTPSNPTGAIYSVDELAGLAAVLRANSHVLVLLDEVYEHIRFTPEPLPHLLQVAPDLRDQVLIVNGASKTYAMTGWRIGYGAGPAALIKAMTVVQSQYTSGASSIGQAAALAALAGDQAFVAEARQAYLERRQIVIDGIAAIPLLSLVPPEGAFFAYPGCAAVIGKTRPDGRRIETDDDFVDYLLEEVGVATVAGSAFGLSPYFRLSFAASTSDITKAVARIGDAVARLT